MINQQLLDYIRQQLTGGVAREIIKTNLMSQGWSEQDIAEGFITIEKSTATPVPPAPMPVSPIQPIVPIQSTAILSEKVSAPSSVKRFEILMYLSIAVGMAASLSQYSQFLTSTSVLYVLLVPAFTILAKILCVWLTAHKKVNWTRWLLLILLLVNIPSLFTAFIGFGVSSFGGTAPLMGILNLLQIALQIAALCFVFSKSANEWFTPQQVVTNIGGGINPGNTVNTIWTKGIPRTNVGFGIASLLLVFGLDLMIILSSPDLKPFWYMMLGVLAVFAVFFYLENFVFSKKFADTSASVDKGISVVVVLRNLLFILNFIPFIQLLGLAAIVYGGWILGIIYIGLIIARFNQTKKTS